MSISTTSRSIFFISCWKFINLNFSCYQVVKRDMRIYFKGADNIFRESKEANDWSLLKGLSIFITSGKERTRRSKMRKGVIESHLILFILLFCSCAFIRDITYMLKLSELKSLAYTRLHFTLIYAIGKTLLQIA